MREICIKYDGWDILTCKIVAYILHGHHKTKYFTFQHFILVESNTYTKYIWDVSNETSPFLIKYNRFLCWVGQPPPGTRLRRTTMGKAGRRWTPMRPGWGGGSTVASFPGVTHTRAVAVAELAHGTEVQPGGQSELNIRNGFIQAIYGNSRIKLQTK